MADDKKKLNIDDVKLQVGTGEIDNSMTVGSNSTVTTNNNTRINVENGGTLHYKDAATVKAEHEQRREDFNNFVDKAKEIKQEMHDKSFAGKLEKGLKDFETGMDKICGVKKSRDFDSAINMASDVNTKSADNSFSRG